MIGNVEYSVEDSHLGRGPSRVRTLAHATLALAHNDDIPPIPVHLLDLSDAGAGVSSPIALKAGTGVVIMMSASSSHHFSLGGQIASCVQHAPDDHRIGIEFNCSNAPSVQRIRDLFFP